MNEKIEILENDKHMLIKLEQNDIINLSNRITKCSDELEKKNKIII